MVNKVVIGFVAGSILGLILGSILMNFIVRQNDSIQTITANFLSCDLQEPGFLKYLGFKDQEDCRVLYKYMYEGFSRSCINDFANSSTTKLVEECVKNKINRQNIEISAEYLKYKNVD